MRQSGGLPLAAGWTAATPYDLPKASRQSRDCCLPTHHLLFLHLRTERFDIPSLPFDKHSTLEEKPSTSNPIMTYLEICLSMGYIPEKYRTTFFEKVLDISKILSDHERSDSKHQNNTIPVYYRTSLGQLYNGDCIQVMKSIQDDSVDLVFADPPFNLAKTYDEGIDDDLSTSKYLSWCYEWLSECIRILKPGGSLFVYNIPKWATYYSEYLNKRLTFRSWIALDMKFSLPLSGRLNPAHYALLYYVKGQKPNVFNNPRIPIQTCRHCGGEIKDYGGYKNKMNPSGVNVSDVWLDIYPVRHKNTKNRTYNELPVKMLDRIISMSTNPGDVVFDPFGGSGTTYAVAEILERRWIGSELGNCVVITDRLSNLEKDRKLLKKVHEEKDIIFPESVRKLRKQNGFWLCEDFSKTPHICHCSDQQVTMEEFKN